MAAFDEVPADVWTRFFELLRSYIARGRYLAVCRQWSLAGRQAGPSLLLPSLVFPATEPGKTRAFDVIVRQPLRLREAPSFQEVTRVVGSLAGGRIVVAYEVPNPTMYAILDLWGREARRPIPDRLQLPGAVGAQLVGIKVITQGADLFAAITDGAEEPRLVFWRTGMEAWFPPQPQAQGPVGWQGFVPDYPIDDVLYHEPTDSFFIINTIGALWAYRPVRLQGGGVAFEGHMAFSAVDFLVRQPVRYICAAGPGELLLVARSPIPGRSRVHRLLRNAEGGWSRLLREPRGALLFVGHGCSRAYPAAAGTPVFIHYLDGSRWRYVSPGDTTIDSVLGAQLEHPSCWMLPPNREQMD